MNLDKLRVLYDQQMRLSLVPFGLRQETTPYITRLTSDLPHASDNCIIHSRLSAHTADRAIESEIDHFAALGYAFEWKVYAHDSPSDLLDRLRQSGFTIGPRESLMICDASADAQFPSPSIAAEIRRMVDPAMLSDLLLTRPASDRDSFAPLADWLKRELIDQPDQLSVYIAYVNRVPAAGAWLRTYPHADFADLWGGGTLPEFRHRGLYSTLVQARLAEARQRGIRYLTVDAGPQSEPILLKLGFQVLAHCNAAIWSPSTT